MKTHIVIHHSATADGSVFNWGAIRRYHTSFRIDGVIVTRDEFERRKAEGLGVRFEAPWRDIGYHFGLELVGTAWEVIFGRMPEDTGAHCPELLMNQVGIGICVVGNFDAGAPGDDVVGKLAVLVKWLMQMYRIPAKNVWGHREAQAAGGVAPEHRKTCPGAKFDMEAFRKILEG